MLAIPCGLAFEAPFPSEFVENEPAAAGRLHAGGRPREWEAFWAFWCDKVQPTVRKAVGRDDIWGIGRPMSASVDTWNAFFQFAHAYEADFVTRDGRLVIDEPLVRDRLVKVLDSYTAIWRKGCTPPDAVGWDATGNNKAFLAQTVVMTLNQTLYSSYYAAVSGNWRHAKMEQERVWENAIYRIATKGITPEQAAGEAIARVKQLLRE